MEVEQQTYTLKWGPRSHWLKVHKNPYLWATNKTGVATITVHSCINSSQGNC